MCCFLAQFSYRALYGQMSRNQYVAIVQSNHCWQLVDLKRTAQWEGALNHYSLYYFTHKLIRHDQFFYQPKLKYDTAQPEYTHWFNLSEDDRDLKRFLLLTWRGSKTRLASLYQPTWKRPPGIPPPCLFRYTNSFVEQGIDEPSVQRDSSDLIRLVRVNSPYTMHGHICTHISYSQTGWIHNCYIVDTKWNLIRA